LCRGIGLSLLFLVCGPSNQCVTANLENNNRAQTRHQSAWFRIRQHFGDRFRLKSSSTHNKFLDLHEDQTTTAQQQATEAVPAALYTAMDRHLGMDRDETISNSTIPTHLSAMYAAMARQLALEQQDSSEATKKEENVPWFRALASAIPFKKVFEVGMMFYILWNVAKAASELVSEYAQELLGAESSGVFSQDQVSQVLEFLQLPPSEGKEFLESSSRDRLHFPALILARNLALTGLPLTSRRRAHIAGRVPKPTVESVLLSLTRYEFGILQQSLWVPPTNEDSSSAWNDIVGLDVVKDNLLSVVNSITQLDRQHSAQSLSYDSLFKHSSPSKGVLLYGPPGCGKSFLIKALSLKSRLPCLVITPSVLLRKYVGETNQQCRALFSLAQKLSPCILCIDEVDALFRARSDTEHEVSRDLKTEFLQHLDGMLSSEQTSSTSDDRSDPDRSNSNSNSNKRQNLVVAATNRPFDVDSAILRRSTRSFFVGLPDLTGRIVMLKHFLKDVPTSEDDMDYWKLAVKTENYSPSDLRRLLQEAATSGPLREQDAKPHSFSLSGLHGTNQKQSSLRPLVTGDVLQALNVVPATHMSPDYRWSLSNFAHAQNIDGNQQFSTPGVPIVSNEGGVSKWETNYGNFFFLGSLPIDSETWDSLTELSEKLIEVSMEEESDTEDDETDGEEVD